MTGRVLLSGSGASLASSSNTLVLGDSDETEFVVSRAALVGGTGGHLRIQGGLASGGTNGHVRIGAASYASQQVLFV